jgi:hypothetical protein
VTRGEVWMFRFRRPDKEPAVLLLTRPDKIGVRRARRVKEMVQRPERHASHTADSTHGITPLGQSPALIPTGP